MSGSSTFRARDGTRLAYTVAGEGLPLLCVPGGPGRAGAYLEDLAGLTATRTVIILDNRGTGASEVPADLATLRFDHLAHDLESLRAHLGLPTADVLAHSAGCIVAQVWAATYADRARSLVLVTPSDRLQGGGRGDVEAIHRSRAGEPWYAAARAAEAALATAPPEGRQALVRQTRPFFYGRWDERTRAHAATADGQSNPVAEEGFGFDDHGDIDVARVLAGLRAVTARVLVLGGGRDGITGVASVDAVAACFPNARSVVLPSAGHFPWVDEPEAFRSAIEEFLAAPTV